MTDKEIAETALKFFEILMAWPVILLVLVLLFRGQIVAFFSEMSHRLKRAEIGPTKFEFEIQLAAFSALPEVIESGVKEYKDNPEQLADFILGQARKLPEFQSTAPTSTILSLHGRSILWVDDEPIDNVYEVSILKRFGANVLSARSTKEALAFLNRGNFDLIISDVHRNENGISNPNAGYELLEELDRTKRKIPFIFYTNKLAYLDPSKTRSAYGAADTPAKLIELAIQVLR